MDDLRIGRKYAVYIRINFDSFCLQSSPERRGCRIATASSKCRQLSFSD